MEKVRKKKEIKYLDDEYGERMKSFLKPYKRVSFLAKELGISPTMISIWKKAGRFPYYCKPFLDLIEIRERIASWLR